MVDGKRELPASTGIIDVKSFLGALEKLGFDGPVRVEPFNDAVRRMPPDEAAGAAMASLKKGVRRADRAVHLSDRPRTQGLHQFREIETAQHAGDRDLREPGRRLLARQFQSTTGPTARSGSLRCEAPAARRRCGDIVMPGALDRDAPRIDVRARARSSKAAATPRPQSPTRVFPTSTARMAVWCALRSLGRQEGHHDISVAGRRPAQMTAGLPGDGVRPASGSRRRLKASPDERRADRDRPHGWRQLVGYRGIQRVHRRRILKGRCDLAGARNGQRLGRFDVSRAGSMPSSCRSCSQRVNHR